MKNLWHTVPPSELKLVAQECLDVYLAIQFSCEGVDQRWALRLMTWFVSTKNNTYLMFPFADTRTNLIINIGDSRKVGRS